MTLITLNKKQKDKLHETVKNLATGDLILELFTQLYLEEKPELVQVQFNTRTAEEILNDGYATGCTDFAIVLCSFLNELKIPYKYVDVLEKRWLDAPMEEKKVMGHAFVSIGDILLDPQRKIIYHDPKFVLQRYEIFGEGKEPLDLGLTDFRTNIGLYFNFKEEYQKNKTA